LKAELRSTWSTRLMGGQAAVIVGCLVLVITLTALVAPHYEEAALRTAAKEAAGHFAQMLGDPLWDLDIVRAEELGTAFASDHRVVRLTIVESETGTTRTIEKRATNDTILESQPVVYNGHNVGSVALAFDRGVYRAQIVRDVRVATSVALLVLVASLLGMAWQLGKLRESEARLRAADEALQHSHAALAQAQKMESIGRLAGGVAHDFNNMLGVIMGHVELALRQTAPGAPLHRDLQEVLKATNRSADLTRQLLAFARKQAIAPRLLDVNDVVGDSLNMLERLIGEDIELEWTPAPDLWPVLMDSSQLDQMIANLCVNARDAIPDVGTLAIATANCVVDEAFSSAHADAAPGDFVKLSVRDSGVGMTDDVASKIFEPFFTTKESGSGTGLGLATVYGAVVQNRGFITVASVVGAGTTFELYLPRHAGAAPQPAIIEPTSDGSGRETVLIVEDEPMLLRMAARSLEVHGYEVLRAASPAEAVRMAADHDKKIHLLLTDIVMPTMNGRDLAVAIKSTRPKIKVLFMSGYSPDMGRGQRELPGNAQFIGKPFSVGELAEKVRAVLDQDGVVDNSLSI
jgi:two-component system cell cycle sensor histidine kinase/response regulator CckA